MKKVVSLLLALVLIFAMSSVAMAATTVTTQAELETIFTNGGEAVLGADITVDAGKEFVVATGKTVTLDLAGKTITGVDTKASGSFGLITVKAGASLTINDTVGGGKITLSATNDRNWDAYSSTISNQQGTVTITAGTIEHTGGTDMAYAIDVLTNGTIGNAYLYVNGGQISSTYRAIRQFANSSTNECVVEITDGVIEAPVGLFIQSPNEGNNNSTTKIEGGKIDASSNALYIYAYYSEEVAVEVTDGEIVGNVYMFVYYDEPEKATEPTLSITGGSIDGDINDEYNYEDDSIVVSGGTFPAESKFVTDYLDPSVEIKTDSNGNTYVGDSIPVPPAPKRYDINVADTKNGDVTVKGSASYDSGVIITAAPHYGYEVGKVTVTAADGKEVKVTNRADGTYSFSMPRGEVSIKVTFVPQGEAVKMVLTIGSKTAIVDGAAVQSDVAPVIKAGRTFLPIRLIAENLGAKVEWNNDAQTVTITKGETVIVLTIGSTTVTVNGQPTELEAAVFIESSRTFLPVRFIAEKLGADVEWNGATKEVTITGRK